VPPSAWATGARSNSRPCNSHVRCSVIPSCGMWSRTVPPSARAKSASSASRPHTSYERSSILTSCRLCSRTALGGNLFKVGRDGVAERCCGRYSEALLEDALRWRPLEELRGRRLRSQGRQRRRRGALLSALHGGFA